MAPARGHGCDARLDDSNSLLENAGVGVRPSVRLEALALAVIGRGSLIVMIAVRVAVVVVGGLVVVVDDGVVVASTGEPAFVFEAAVIDVVERV